MVVMIAYLCVWPPIGCGWRSYNRSQFTQNADILLRSALRSRVKAARLLSFAIENYSDEQGIKCHFNKMIPLVSTTTVSRNSPKKKVNSVPEWSHLIHITLDYKVTPKPDAPADDDDDDGGRRRGRGRRRRRHYPPPVPPYCPTIKGSSLTSLVTLLPRLVSLSIILHDHITTLTIPWAKQLPKTLVSLSIKYECSTEDGTATVQLPPITTLTSLTLSNVNVYLIEKVKRSAGTVAGGRGAPATAGHGAVLGLDTRTDAPLDDSLDKWSLPRLRTCHIHSPSFDASEFTRMISGSMLTLTDLDIPSSIWSKTDNGDGKETYQWPHALHALRILDTTSTSELMESIISCPTIKRLKLVKPAKAQDFKMLAKMTQLTALSFPGDQFTTQIMKSLPQLSFINGISARELKRQQLEANRVKRALLFHRDNDIHRDDSDDDKDFYYQQQKSRKAKRLTAAAAAAEAKAEADRIDAQDDAAAAVAVAAADITSQATSSPAVNDEPFDAFSMGLGESKRQSPPTSLSSSTSTTSTLPSATTVPSPAMDGLTSAVATTTTVVVVPTTTTTTTTPSVVSSRPVRRSTKSKSIYYGDYTYIDHEQDERERQVEESQVEERQVEAALNLLTTLPPPPPPPPLPSSSSINVTVSSKDDVDMDTSDDDNDDDDDEDDDDDDDITESKDIEEEEEDDGGGSSDSGSSNDNDSSDDDDEDDNNATSDDDDDDEKEKKKKKENGDKEAVAAAATTAPSEAVPALLVKKASPKYFAQKQKAAPKSGKSDAANKHR
jgi:hypothetical protein